MVLKGRGERLEYHCTYQAGDFPILPEAGLQQKNKSVLTKDLLSLKSLTPSNHSKASKKASSLFANLTCSFGSLYPFPDFPRQHRSVRKHRQIKEHTSSSAAGAQGRSCARTCLALSLKQDTGAQSWCSPGGCHFSSPGHFLTTPP